LKSSIFSQLKELELTLPKWPKAAVSNEEKEIKPKLGKES